jgi:hypothetical protein
MFFLDKNGKMQQGEALTAAEKGLYDDLKALFHEKVCGGYDAYGTEKCHDLAVYFVQHFSIEPKDGLSFAGLTVDEREKNAPKAIEPVVLPEGM